MRTKKIISLVLCFVLVSTTILSVISMPLNVKAAETEDELAGEALVSETNSMETIVKESEKATTEDEDTEMFIMDGQVLVSYTGQEEHLVIPEELAVSEIGEGAFSENRYIKTVIIPDSVKIIQKCAFKNCENLTEVILPDLLERIEDYAFAGCVSLESITIPGGVIYLGEGVFEGCDHLKITDTSLETMETEEVKEEINTDTSEPENKKSDPLKLEIAEEETKGSVGADGNLVADFKTAAGSNLVTNGDYVLEGTVLVSYFGKEANVAIPENLGITEIGAEAFQHNSYIRTVTIPAGVKKIGENVFAGCFYVEEISLPEGVTSIGKEAFYACCRLTKINLPESLKSIGSGAFISCDFADVILPQGLASIGDNTFRNCRQLTRITLPEGLKSIGNEAFYGCSQLTSLTLPEGLENIGDSAFYYCSQLTGMNIPSSVVNIGTGIFIFCSALKNITVSENSKAFISVDGVLYNKAKTELVAYPKGKDGNSYKIPEGVTKIAESAFYGCNQLASISLPEGLKSIGNEAFSGCNQLTILILPEGLKSIGDLAFRYCFRLISINIPSSVVSIGEDIFMGCSALGSITVSETSEVFTCVDGVLYNKTKTELIKYPVDKGGDSYEIPAGVTKIGASAFESCAQLTSITLPEGLESIGNAAFKDCAQLTSISLPEGLESIGNDTFMMCTQLTNIILPEGLRSIGDYAFFSCSQLTSVSLPEGLESIGNQAFSWCDQLISVSLPASLESIGDYGFLGCSLLTSVNIPSNVINVGVRVFSNCSGLASINVSDANVAFTSLNGVLYNKAKTELIKYPENKRGDSYEIPAGVKKIGNDAFMMCTQLTSITLPEGLESIGDNAFNCCRLISVSLSEGLESIGKDAFYYCTQLSSITLPESLKSIGDYAFNQCDQLTSISLSESLESIGNGAFSGCRLLTSVDIPSNVINMGERVFSNCSALTSINVSDANVAFTSLDGVLYNKAKTKLMQYPAQKGEANYKIPDGVTEVSTYAVAYNSNIKEIVFPLSTKYMGLFALSGCSNLEKVTILNSQLYLENAFVYWERPNCTIYGISGSAAQKFADNYGLNFIALSNQDIGELIDIDMPTNVKVTKASDTSLTISWAAASGVTGYEVYCATSKNGAYQKTGETAGNSYTYERMAVGQTYYYRVCSYILANDMIYRSNFTGIQSYSLPTPQPTGVTTAVASATSVKINWTKAAGVTGYEVYAATSKNGDYKRVKTTSGTSFTYTGLMAGKTYYFKVRSYKTISGTTQYSTYTAISTRKLTVPTPANVKLASSSATALKISWSKVSDASGYEIYRAASKTGTYKIIKTTSGSTTSFTNKSLTNGKTYYYKVRAFKTVNGSKKYSSYCGIISQKAALAKTKLSATAKSKTSIKLSWTKVPGATKYEIYRATSKSGTYKKIKTGTSSSYTDTSLKSNKTYYYKIKAVQGSYKSAYSTVQSAKTKK